MANISEVRHQQSRRELFLEYFYASDAFDYARDFFPLPFMAREKRDEALESTAAESMLERAKLLNIDQEELKRLVAARIRQLVTWKPEPLDPAATIADRKKRPSRAQSRINKHIRKDDISGFLGTHIEALRHRIQDIPGGLDKAMLGLDALVESGTWYGSNGLYDAMVLLRDKISQNHVAVEIDFWKHQRERDRKKGLPLQQYLLV